MSFRKLAREVFGAAKERYRERQHNASNPQPLPGSSSSSTNPSQDVYGSLSSNQSQSSNTGFASPPSTSSFPGEQYHHQAQLSQSMMGQGPNYPQAMQQAPPQTNYGYGYQSPQAYGPPPFEPPNKPANIQSPPQNAAAHQNPQDSGQRLPQGPAYPMMQSPHVEGPNVRQSDSGNLSVDIFVPLQHTNTIPIDQCDSHPAPRHCIKTREGRVQDPGCQPRDPAPAMPLQTNAFYGNLLLGDQGCSAWTHPYSLQWSKGQGNARSWGLAVSQIEREQLAFGEPTMTGASRYYINPIGIHSMILSAAELQASTTLSLDSLQAFSANVNLAPNAQSPPIITFPLLQGMGFVTGIYQNSSPLVETSVFFRDLQGAGLINNGATSKYRIVLEDGKTWLLYITPQHTTSQMVPATMLKNTSIGLPSGFTGTVQIAKLPHGSSEEFYDRSAGAYAVSCTMSARVYGDQGTYTMTWEKGGQPNPLIMYALSHHVSGFTRTTAPHMTPMKLQTTTKGSATGVLADVWQVNHQLPTDMGFAPWAPDRKVLASLPKEALDAIVAAGRAEAEQDVMGQCNLDSMYFSGKGLGKFAMMAIALHDIARDLELTRKVVEKLKQAFAVFVENRQRTPLVYERGWKGVVSRVGMENAGADFGNGYYNDHHFHYGYFVYTAAVIAHLDPSWLPQDGGKNVTWVNMLVRDFANPINDAGFPFYRSFDWFHGHSWAKGLFESGDGKDEESTSEDAFASYALKMWGAASGDPNLEARGNLMLAMQAKVFQTYFLMEDAPGRTVQPEQIIKNKVTGITFENKVDHATYFGMNPEYIQGIHMIPLGPPSTLIRRPSFVREEWEAYFSNGRVDQVGGGWRGILYANLAIIDPKKAYSFFSQQNFDWGWLDGGASRTWYLAYCATLGGV